MPVSVVPGRTISKAAFLMMWLMWYKQVQQKGEDDEVIARAIADKLGDTPGVSYSDIAGKALECGRTDLAIRVGILGDYVMSAGAC